MGRLRQVQSRIGSLAPRIARLVEEPGRNDRPFWHGWYKTARWQKLRWKVLTRDLFTCAMCGKVAAGKGEAVADHKTPHRGNPDLFWDEHNLQCLCKDCHDSEKQRIDKAR